MTRRARLEELARLFGVDTAFYDALGNHRVASDEALVAVLASLGAELSRPDDVETAIQRRHASSWSSAIDAVIVAWAARAPTVSIRGRAGASSRLAATLSFEHGGTRTVEARFSDLPLEGSATVDGSDRELRTLALGAELPLGYHRLELDVGGAHERALVVSAPARAFVPEMARALGIFLPLYALHSRRSLGAGDATDLSRLVDFAREVGASVVGTLPLFASFLDEPFEPSPYAPVSRLFWNELFVDPARCPELPSSPSARARLESDAFQREAAALRAMPLVDYARQHALLSPVLSDLARTFFEHGPPDELERFLEAVPRARDYARFRAATEANGPFSGWADRPSGGSLDDGDVDHSRVRYHLYAQLRAREQLFGACDKARGLGVGMYLDLPLGVHPDGYDAWRDRDAFLGGVSAGAPPDALFVGGQEWGFRPLDPQGLRRTGYRYLRDCLEHPMRSAGILRIDHVMGLHRMYCIPTGMTATEGVYVRFPAEELHAILTLESVRARCMLVGEDLGTVPDEVRTAMEAHALHRMYVLPFELRPEQPMIMGTIPEASVASVNTHDLPSFQGWWDASDVEVRREMGLLDETGAERETRDRAALTRTLAERLAQPHEPAPVLRACLDALAASDARLLLVSLEDLWLEPEPQNVPGTHRERSNWRRKARLSLEEIAADESIRNALQAMVERRRT